MAHELTFRHDGTVEMAYVGETPWHHLGKRLEVGTPIPQWIPAAGMDWKVEQTPIKYETEGSLVTFPDRFALLRSDNKMPLGVVSSDYCILHPFEVLEFFDDLVKSVGLELETAGNRLANHHVGFRWDILGHYDRATRWLVSLAGPGPGQSVSRMD